MGRINKNSLRLNITLPEELVLKIDNFCEKYGLTRSAFLALASTEKMASFSMIEQMPLLVSEAVKRGLEDAKK